MLYELYEDGFPASSSSCFVASHLIFKVKFILSYFLYVVEYLFFFQYHLITIVLPALFILGTIG